MAERNDWQCSAAYLYVMGLNESGLAWEYLRRNPDYRADWERAVRGTGDVRHWGLVYPVDPDLDARDANPVWIAPDERWVRLVPDDDPAAERFDLWALPGRKTLTTDGTALRVHIDVDGELAGLVVPQELGDGDGFACVKPDGTKVPLARAGLDFVFGAHRRSSATP